MKMLGKNVIILSPDQAKEVLVDGLANTILRTGILNCKKVTRFEISDGNLVIEIDDLRVDTETTDASES